MRDILTLIVLAPIALGITAYHLLRDLWRGEV